MCGSMVHFLCGIYIGALRVWAVKPATFRNISVSLIHDALVCFIWVCRRVVVEKPDGSSGSFFSFDRVYGGSGAPFEDLYPSSVAPLVDGMFEGYSATAFAYGGHFTHEDWTVLGMAVVCCLRCAFGVWLYLWHRSTAAICVCYNIIGHSITRCHVGSIGYTLIHVILRPYSIYQGM